MFVTMKKTFILSVLLVAAVLVVSMPLLGCSPQTITANSDGGILQNLFSPSKFTPSAADNKTLRDLPPEFLELAQVYQKLQQNYVDRSQMDPKKLAQGAMRGMVEAVGDPYTEYYTPQVYDATMIQLTGQYSGIGAYIGKKNTGIVIIAPMPGSPAEAAGIKSGDYILKIDGSTTDNMTSDQASQLIRGQAGTKVVLSIGREGQRAPLEITVTRNDIRVDSVKTEMHGQVAYIRIQQFILPTADDLSKALKDSLDKGARGVILDLRDNPGGILTQAVDVASQFLSRGIVVKVVDKNGIEQVLKVKAGGIATSVPVIVLINGGSASASEIVAGALQDNERAKLAGAKSFGKASVQNVVKLDDGSAIKITTAHYYTPNGTLISGKGLAPDYPTDLLGDNLTKWADDYINKTIAGQPVEAPPVKSQPETAAQNQ
jgi:carboxyl-terminal processing protease